MINQQICLKCQKVFIGNSQCCGEVESFDPVQHAHLLIGLSIAEASKRWENHPIYRGIRDRRSEEGNFGHATNVIEFVDELVRLVDKQTLYQSPDHCDLIPEVHKHFKGLTEEEAWDLLWAITSYPFGTPAKVKKDLVLMAAVSGNNASVAAKMVWDRAVQSQRDSKPPEEPEQD